MTEKHLKSENIASETVENLKTGVPFSYDRPKPVTPFKESIPREPPQWLQNDRKVLRFHGYFQEPVVELSNENFRVRKVTINYYLDDDTIFVNEPRIENSGLLQGSFIKRHPIPKPDGSGPYHWLDFQIGSNFQFYDRTFKIYDADRFTRDYFADAGKMLAPPDICPEDNFQKNRLMVEFKQMPPDMPESKEYREVKLGGGHPNKGLEQFIKNDRKVLSFDVQWEDDTPDGGFKFYKMNFYLSDGTLEVKELKQINTGVDPFPMLLRRQKLSKEPIMTHCPGLSLKETEYYKPEDLFCGNYIKVYNRDLFIYNCDDYTREWYQQNYGFNQQQIPLKKMREFVPPQPVPNYNGYGTEEDSMGNVLKLLPKPPQIDMNKYFANDMNILRFEAQLLTNEELENERQFVVTFFCADDSIMVYEIASRNSGRQSCKFLEKNKFHKNPKTGNYYQDIDFQIGDTIILNNYRFLLLKADEFTHKFWESNPQRYPYANEEFIRKKILNQVPLENKQQFITKLLSYVALQSKAQIVPYSMIKKAFDKASIKLNRMEDYMLARKASEQNNEVNVEKFYNWLGRPL